MISLMNNSKTTKNKHTKNKHTKKTSIKLKKKKNY